MLPIIHSAVLSFTVAIAGANGDLGRELVQQTLERNWNCLAITRNKPLYYPFRGGWLSNDESKLYPVEDDKLLNVNYTQLPKAYDALVISLGNKPFIKDDSYLTCEHLVKTLPSECQKICLVSAHGVGDSINDSNFGIKAMRGWYLRQVYESKRLQEDMISALNDVETIVMRPKVLSYGTIPFNSIHTSREKLAREILDTF